MRKAFSASVFCRRNGKVLLIKHNLLGTWLPIGGELEHGETPQEAAIRELEEETGFKNPAFVHMHRITGIPVGFICYEEHEAGPKGLHMNFCFLADVDSDTPVSDGSWSEYRWVDPLEELLHLKPEQHLVPRNVWQIIVTLKAEGWLDA